MMMGNRAELYCVVYAVLCLCLYYGNSKGTSWCRAFSLIYYTIVRVVRADISRIDAVCVCDACVSGVSYLD